METTKEPWVSMDDMVGYFGVTPETIRNWINEKNFPAVKVGGRWRFKVSEVDEWAECDFRYRSAAKKKQSMHRCSSTLIQGDCLESLKSLQTDSIDLILTDPPYNLGLFMQRRDTNLKRMRENYFGAAGWDDLSFEAWVKSMNDFFGESARVLKPGGAIIVFMAVIKVESLIHVAQKYGLYYKTTGTWHKLNPMPRNMNLHFINSTESWVYFVNQTRTSTFNNDGKAIHDFVETPITPKGERIFGKHPTQKPVKLMNHFIQILSHPGDYVLDPFMGSGSTGVASLNAERNFIGIELDQNYYSIAEQRIKESAE